MIPYDICSPANPVVSVFSTELRDGGNGLGAVYGHSSTGEFMH